MNDHCTECGMPCLPGDYHPYAACVMYRQCRQSEKVESWLKEIMDYGAKQAIAALEAQPRLPGELEEILRFLMGETPIEATPGNPYWFGAGTPLTEKGPYWWRNRLQAFLPQPAQPEREGDARGCV